MGAYNYLDGKMCTIIGYHNTIGKSSNASPYADYNAVIFGQNNYLEGNYREKEG